MKILITGNGGYIGSILTPYLIQNNHQITGLDTGFYQNASLYKGDGKNEHIHIKKDVRNIQIDDIEDVDAVVHLAALSNDPLGQLHPEITYQINYEASVRLARLCKKAGVSKFIFSSSCSVYGLGNGEFKTEESQVNPQTVYAECKVLAERDISKLADKDFSPVFIRNATVYGPSPSMRFDIVLNNLAGMAWTTEKINLISNGLPWRPLVHVKDVCKAILYIVNAPRETVHNQIFNVGDTRENYQVKDIAGMVDITFPGCETLIGSDDDNRSYRVSFDKLQETFPDFRCDYSLKEGVKELHDIFSCINLQSKTFFDKPYTRLKQIKFLRKSRQIDDALYWLV